MTQRETNLYPDPEITLLGDVQEQLNRQGLLGLRIGVTNLLVAFKATHDPDRST